VWFVFSVSQCPSRITGVSIYEIHYRCKVGASALGEGKGRGGDGWPEEEEKVEEEEEELS